jgi:ABC-type Zn uptake system ZnuABC Zn-binding protein ZnuA
VVATLPTYADLAQQIGGNQVLVTSIAHPLEDAHFVRPKPSFALELKRADLFITTGLDLELWVPPLLDRAGNASVREGGTGYVTAYTGIRLLDVPQTVDRRGGDLHIYGNPHLHTDPLRLVQIAENITVGLGRVAPDRLEVWREGLAVFTDRVHRSLFGDQLVDLFGGETLARLAQTGQLMPFLDDNDLEGRPLVDQLGGWLGEARALRGQSLICYHQHWAYLEERFGLACAGFVESRPGIPPTPGHISELVARMEDEELRVVLAAAHFDRGRVESVAIRGGAAPVIVPLYPGAPDGPEDCFALYDLWVEGLITAFDSR